MCDRCQLAPCAYRYIGQLMAGSHGPVTREVALAQSKLAQLHRAACPCPACWSVRAASFERWAQQQNSTHSRHSRELRISNMNTTIMDRSCSRRQLRKVHQGRPAAPTCRPRVVHPRMRRKLRLPFAAGFAELAQVRRRGIRNRLPEYRQARLLHGSTRRRRGQDDLERIPRCSFHLL